MFRQNLLSKAKFYTWLCKYPLTSEPDYMQYTCQLWSSGMTVSNSSLLTTSSYISHCAITGKPKHSTCK